MKAAKLPGSSPNFTFWKARFIVYILFLCFGSPAILRAEGEKIIALGGENRWTAVEGRLGLTELNAARPWPVIALSSATESGLSYGAQVSQTPDLALSFDSPAWDRQGRYAITAASGSGGTLLSIAGPEWARLGEGAAFFSAAAGVKPGPGTQAAGPLVIVAQDPQALFAPGSRPGDFSLEFWLYPLNMENGEQILSWTASRPRAQGGYYFQHIRCSAVKNRLRWSFGDFFTAPGGEETRSVTMEGISPVVPKLWSHHLIRFDAETGLLEYLVNGSTEALSYLTTGGTEGGDVYTPVIGLGGEFILGKGYTGLMDEFRIHDRYAGRTGREFGLEGDLRKYPPAGGRLETRAFDLGPESGRVLRLEALGGRISLGGASIRNAYAGRDRLSFDDSSAVQFFMRTGDNPYRWTEADWQVVEAGIDLPPAFQGRYVQLAASLYPSADGETSPYLEELRIVYQPNEAPRPPVRLTALGRDGAVELSWRNSEGEEADGYLVYYGNAAGEYFGHAALQGPSPIDAGKRSALRIEGLENGTLYYFAVASYRVPPAGSGPRRPEDRRVGEFSREVTARPLLAYTLGRYE
ncbi:MAG: hypothetical protein LBQ46_14055 [Treponema sp.]|jgi:hypothetical protein|nr:hypothetical protein [Treponema sp.]